MKLRTTNYKPQTPQKGFTLIEAIVSTALFAFVVSSMIGVYIAVLRLDTRTRAQRVVANDARFIMDYLAREIRNGRIDYASYPNQLTCEFSCGNPAYQPTDLYLINQNNEAERIDFWNSTTNAVMSRFDCSAADCDIRITKPSGTTKLNSDNVRVTMLKIYTTPWGDPFAPCPPCDYNQQPNVTVMLQLISNTSPRDMVKINLDSTFSTLYYPPRP